MLKALLVVGIGILLWGALVQGAYHLRRRRARATFARGSLVRSEHGVSIQARLGGPAIPGLDPRRNNRTVGDLLLSADRFVLASRRGVLLDLGAAPMGRFSSVRSTGPGRLVLEGEVPRPAAPAVPYRFDLMVADAPGWVGALAPWVRPGGTTILGPSGPARDPPS
jgi:hypothetical protein